jgi:hypothetical protein
MKQWRGNVEGRGSVTLLFLLCLAGAPYSPAADPRISRRAVATPYVHGKQCRKEVGRRARDRGRVRPKANVHDPICLGGQLANGLFGCKQKEQFTFQTFRRLDVCHRA